MFKKKKTDDNKVSLDDVVDKLTVDEKIKLLSGADFWRTAEIKDSEIPIPEIMVSDGPIGLRKQKSKDSGVNDSIEAVCFPAAVGLAASFDEDLMKKLGEILGEECQAEDLAVLLGPAVNIKRSPLCGRNFEYYSEDPYLAGKLASSYIKGVQSKNVGTSVKHFAANSQETRRMTSSSEIDERALREIYFPAFEIAVKEAQPWTVMCSYNKINGVHASEDKKLLTDVLRDEWGFKGLVMSDWGAVHDRVDGVKAGCDLEMPSSNGMGERKLRAAYDAGELTEEQLNKSVRRLINIVFKFTQNRLEAKFDREEDHNKSAEISEKTMVLLKNEDKVLPLDKTQNIVYIGEYAEKPRFQGGGSSHVNVHRVTTCLDETRNYTNVQYYKGFGTADEKTNQALEDDAVRAASQADVAVIFAGLPISFESEGADRKTMRLPEPQNRLIERVCAVQKNVVVVLQNGSPVEMPWIDGVKAVLESYLGGEGVGTAQARILFGEVSPTAKLAETFPLKYSDTPAYQNFPGTFNTVEYRESIFVGYRYYDTAKKNVLFPFGYGLTYTTFEYSDLKIDSKTMSPGGKIKVTFTVKNTGDFDAAEIAQIYVSDKSPKVFKAEKELKGFKKIELKKGEQKTVALELDERAFSYYNVDEKKFVSDDGEYGILVGSSSRDIKLSGSVSLTGFSVHPSPYDIKTEEIYRTGDIQSVSREDFEKLIGRKIVVDKPHAPFTRDNCFGDMAGTKMGDFLIRMVKTVTGKLNDIEIASSSAMYGSALESPIRQMSAMSGGVLQESAEEKIVAFMNGKTVSIAGLIPIAIKGLFGKLKK